MLSLIPSERLYRNGGQFSRDKHVSDTISCLELHTKWAALHWCFSKDII